MRFLKVFLTFAIIFTAYIGDLIVFRSKYSYSLTFRAITDSLVHASLGFLSSLIFFSHENSFNLQASVTNVTFCTIVSSLIDVDHAFVARSIYLKVSSILIFTYINSHLFPMGSGYYRKSPATILTGSFSMMTAVLL